MKAKEPNNPFSYQAESPVPIPPVEDAWLAMREKLDEEMPVGRSTGNYKRWMLLVLLLLLPLRMIWFMERGGSSVAGGKRAVLAGRNETLAVPGNKHVVKREGTAGRSRKLSTKEESVRIDEQNREQKTKEETVTERTETERTEAEGTVTIARATTGRSDMAKQRQRSGSGKNGQEGEGMKKASIGSRLAQIAGVDRPPFLVASGLTGKQTGALKMPGKPNDVREKSEKPKRAGPGKNSRLLYAAGLQEGKGFPIGSQQQVNYNANGEKVLWPDYIPAPYFQFYPTPKIALQAAIQFNNPQYTESVNIYRKEGHVLPGGLYRQDTIIQVKKLYYFNIPLTVYYSPITNLYLGTGLQFSNLRSGLGLQNNVVHYIPGSGANGPSVGPANTTANGILIDSVTGTTQIPLKENGPAYANMRKTDWRALFEVNYYWKRFTLGLQFQKALREYLYTPVDGSSGKDRNSSLNFYFRYNIWERRSRPKGDWPKAHH